MPLSIGMDWWDDVSRAEEIFDSCCIAVPTNRCGLFPTVREPDSGRVADAAAEEETEEEK